MKECFKLIDKYYSIFNEEPTRIAFIPVYTEEYMNMLKYCIENLKPIDNDIISMFIKKHGDLVNERKVYKKYRFNETGKSNLQEKLELLKKIKKEVPYEKEVGFTEDEADNLLLLAIKDLMEKPELVEFEDGKFSCKEDAPAEIIFYVKYRNRKYKYWQELDVVYKDEIIKNAGAEILAKEENKDLISIKDDYYYCKLESPYEVYFYVECKNITSYFMKVISPRIKIERIKEARLKSGYTFYEDYTSEELTKFPYVDPEVINILTKEHGFNPLIWDGQSWVNCFEIYEK